MSLLDTISTEILPYVNKPIRYLGNELNRITKDSQKHPFFGVLCFPDIYDIGMSHHGLQILYHLINQLDGWRVGRTFHPWTDAEKIMREQNVPLYELDYYQPVSEALWLGFSVQYELQYTSILNLLDLAGIPQYSRERTADHPIIIAGGPCMINPEPLAAFLDIVVVGDGEAVLTALCLIIEEGQRGNLERGEMLEKAAALDGVYVPGLVETQQKGPFCTVDNQVVSPARISSLQAEHYPGSPLVPLIAPVHDRIPVEVMRGCSRGCRFCSAGISYRPVRERAVDEIMQQIEQNIAATGWREVGLLSLSTADHSQLGALLQGAMQMKGREQVRFSLPSTRIDGLDERLVDLLFPLSHNSSITIAPEAGSERLRQVINKGFSNRDIEETTRRLWQRNIQTIKLYFMIGLPTEGPEDIDEMIRLIRSLAAQARKYGKRRMIHVSVSPFSPKPWTPFQWAAMDSTEHINRKNHLIKTGLHDLRNVRVSVRDGCVTRLETIFARGDRSLGALLMTAWKAGCRLDGWDELFDWERWQSILDESPVDTQRFLTRIDLSDRLPWQHLLSATTSRFLQKEYALAHEEQTTADCRLGECSACGLCHQAPPDIQPPRSDDSGQSDLKPQPQPAEAASTELPRFYFRVVYQKCGAIRFLGHRDMVNVINRAVLAAGVPVLFSQGYHPVPRISYGPPLPLGVAGSAEMFDMQLATSILPDRDQMNTCLPDGLRILHIDRLPSKPVSLNAAIVAARYRFEPVGWQLPCDEVHRQVTLFLSSEQHLISITRKNRERQLDIRPLVSDISIQQEGSGSLNALLSQEPGNTCSPQYFIEALFGSGVFPRWCATRTECLLKPADYGKRAEN